MNLFSRRDPSLSRGRTGEFFCPSCKALRSYQRKKVRRFFNARPPPTSVFTERFSVSVIPMAVLQAFIQCGACNQKYKPSVVLRDPTTRRETQPTKSQCFNASDQGRRSRGPRRRREGADRGPTSGNLA